MAISIDKVKKTAKIHGIPLESLRKEKRYLNLKFTEDLDARNELCAFVKEICSKNALTIDGIIKVIYFNRESFSYELLEYLDSLSPSQVKGCIKGFIYKIISGYTGSSLSYIESWGAIVKYDIHEDDSLIKKLLKKIGIYKEIYYYYDDIYVNLYTTPDSELPLYMNHDWPNEEDKKLYEERMHSLDEKNKGNKKPVIEREHYGS